MYSSRGDCSVMIIVLAAITGRLPCCRLVRRGSWSLRGGGRGEALCCGGEEGGAGGDPLRLGGQGGESQGEGAREAAGQLGEQGGGGARRAAQGARGRPQGGDRRAQGAPSMSPRKSDSTLEIARPRLERRASCRYGSVSRDESSATFSDDSSFGE
eukprot:1195539-Prorocentrum_minimum.AAC.13